MKMHALLLGVILLGSIWPLAYAQAPVPFVGQPLVPGTAAPGGGDFVLTVNGTGFVSSAVVNWNGIALQTQFVSESQLTAIVPAADIATAGTASVTVVNPAPGGGTSNPVFFTVTVNVGDFVFFNLASTPRTGPWPRAVATGDFNRDGKLDVAVANCSTNDDSCLYGGTISILLGDGAGNFDLASSPATPSGLDSICAGDFNGDGKLDLAAANFSFNTLSILLGDGNGNFSLISTPVTGYGPYSIATGDFNGDGKLDLAVTNGDLNVSILLGSGTGNFVLTSSPHTGGAPLSVAVGDFNADGKLDLVVANEYSNNVYILLGDGAGNFALASSPATGVQPSSVAVGDFNGDGKLDLATANHCGDDPGCHSPLTGTLSILAGDGTGNFSLVSSPKTGTYPAALAVGDFNGDGKLDLAVANVWDDSVSILLGDGAGNFSTLSATASGYRPVAVAAGDFNGDGRLDFVTAGFGDNTLSVLLQGTPSVTLFPTNLTFATQLIGTRSAPQNVILTNTGTAPLNIASIASTSATFLETNNCASSLLPGASCTINVTFAPHARYTLTASINVTDNAPTSPQTVTLTGVGTVVSLSPSSLDFGNQAVGTTSQPQIITLTNHSKYALNIFGVRLGGLNPRAFAQTSNCGTSVPAGGSCSLSVTFTPANKGGKAATLGVGDNGGGGPQIVNLSGTGV
jgi:hypothetical protein